MALILSFETCTDTLSIALSEDGKSIGLKEKLDSRAHTKDIAVLSQDLIHETGYQLKDLSAVALSEGPGSYTGLRVGCSAAKGLCYSLDIPLLSINSLQAMADYHLNQGEVQEKALIVPMTDARRMEVYCAFYDFKGNCIEKVHAKILDETSFKEYLSDYSQIIFLGNGSIKCKEIFNDDCYTFGSVVHSAKFLSNEANIQYLQNSFVDLFSYEPFYLKHPNITTSKKKTFQK